MIKRCAKLEEKSVEQWILQATGGSMRGVAYELEYTGINVDFGDKEIDVLPFPRDDLNGLIKSISDN